jgi:hypothetical protein
LAFNSKKREKEYFIEYRKNNIEKIRAHRRKNYEEKIQWLEDIKAESGCESCGETRVACLDFHHLNPDNKRRDIGAYTGCSKKRILKELEKCIILCANCHRIAHSK